MSGLYGLVIRGPAPGVVVVPKGSRQVLGILVWLAAEPGVGGLQGGVGGIDFLKTGQGSEHSATETESPGAWGATATAVHGVDSAPAVEAWKYRM